MRTLSSKSHFFIYMVYIICNIGGQFECTNLKPKLLLTQKVLYAK